MATCRHKHLQLQEDSLYSCIVCGQLLVAEPVAAREPPVVPLEPEAAIPEPATPEPVTIAPKRAKPSKKAPEQAKAASEAVPPAEEDPGVDVSSQLQIYLTGKPRQMPASARRRKSKSTSR
jgi:hypothetical protein